MLKYKITAAIYNFRNSFNKNENSLVLVIYFFSLAITFLVALSLRRLLNEVFGAAELPAVFWGGSCANRNAQSAAAAIRPLLYPLLSRQTDPTKNLLRTFFPGWPTYSVLSYQSKMHRWIFSYYLSIFSQEKKKHVSELVISYRTSVFWWVFFPLGKRVCNEWENTWFLVGLDNSAAISTLAFKGKHQHWFVIEFYYFGWLFD